jgi:hypothetical protein
MKLAHYLGVLHHGQAGLAAGLRELADAHADETDVHFVARRLAERCELQSEALARYLRRYGEDSEAMPSARFHGPRGERLGLLRDLHDLYLMATESDLCWIVIGRAAEGARDTELQEEAAHWHDETRVHLAWLRTQLTQTAVQALVVA